MTIPLMACALATILGCSSALADGCFVVTAGIYFAGRGYRVEARETLRYPWFCNFRITVKDRTGSFEDPFSALIPASGRERTVHSNFNKYARWTAVIVK